MSCCCCASPGEALLEGIAEEEEEEEEEEEAGGQEAEEHRRNMDISALREQYRSTRDRQRRHTQVLLFRTVSEELSEAISIVPVTQGLTSPPPAVTVDPDPAAYDPWHVHLDLHRRSCPAVDVRLPTASPEAADVRTSSRCSSSYDAVSSRRDSRKLSADSTSDSLGSTIEEDQFSEDGSRGDPGGSFSDFSPANPVQVSVAGLHDASAQNPSDGSGGDPPDDSQDCSPPGSDGGSTPMARSPSSSATNLDEDPKENRSARGTPARRGSEKASASAPRFTRQLSVGGLGSSSGGQQNYYPFPNRKTPRISEAARRLGMYSSF